jgi:hypothetical protein
MTNILSKLAFVSLPQGGELIIIFMMLAIFGLWIWSLVHCIKNKNLSDTNRIIGIVLIVVLGLLGSLIYLCLPKEQTKPV